MMIQMFYLTIHMMIVINQVMVKCQVNYKEWKIKQLIKQILREGEKKEISMQQIQVLVKKRIKKLRKVKVKILNLAVKITKRKRKAQMMKIHLKVVATQ